MERWDDLKLFLAVARSGTLTAAGLTLGLNVSTLHRRLRAFEEQIGSELFEKGPRGYRLTNAGEALLPNAEDVEEAVFSATRAVVGHDQDASGDVRLTLPLMLLPTLAPHLTDFTKACSRIRLTLHADDVALNLETDTDLALRSTSQPIDAAIGRNLFGLAWGRYAPRGVAVGNLPWITYVGMDPVPAVVWRKKNFPTPKTLMFVHGVPAMHAMLPSSHAQGLLPCFLGDQHPRLQRVDKPVATNRLWLLVHADLRRSARVRAVIDFLVPRLLAERPLFEGA